MKLETVSLIAAAILMIKSQRVSDEEGVEKEKQ
jgi:hypothetical protein